VSVFIVPPRKTDPQVPDRHDKLVAAGIRHQGGIRAPGTATWKNSAN